VLQTSKYVRRDWKLLYTLMTANINLNIYTIRHQDLSLVISAGFFSNKKISKDALFSYIQLYVFSRV
jgi:hypothetical protein